MVIIMYEDSKYKIVMKYTSEYDQMKREGVTDQPLRVKQQRYLIFFFIILIVENEVENVLIIWR